MKSLDIVRRKAAEIECRMRLKRTPAWAPLQRYLQLTKSTGCSYIDYWHLYKQLRQHKPNHVLELGTGASTIVLAHALLENGRGQLTSMEESREWYGHAVTNLPSGLPVEIVLSDTVEDCFSIFRGIRYREVPQRQYEFVFVDGPSYRTQAGEMTFDFDLINVVRSAAVPVRAIIDKRVSTCFVLQRVLPGKVRYLNHLGLGFVDAVTRDDIRGIDTGTPSSSFHPGRTLDFKRRR
jgi:hypothetical protein